MTLFRSMCWIRFGMHFWMKGSLWGVIVHSVHSWKTAVLGAHRLHPSMPSFQNKSKQNKEGRARKFPGAHCSRLPLLSILLAQYLNTGQTMNLFEEWPVATVSLCILPMNIPLSLSKHMLIISLYSSGICCVEEWTSVPAVGGASAASRYLHSRQRF